MRRGGRRGSWQYQFVPDIIPLLRPPYAFFSPSDIWQCLSKSNEAQRQLGYFPSIGCHRMPPPHHSMHPIGPAACCNMAGNRIGQSFIYVVEMFTSILHIFIWN